MKKATHLRFAAMLLCVVLAFFCFGSMSKLSAQTSKAYPITGVIKDAQGGVLPGAIVTLKQDGKIYNASTNEDGQFKLNLPISMKGGSYAVNVRLLGYKQGTFRILPSKSDNYVIKMAASDHTTKEVVVMGYQTVDRRMSTSAVTSISMEDALEPGMTTVDQALEGKIPDLIFMQNSGEVGATARLRIRGTSTLIGNREPLWVLDGFILQDPVDVSTEQLNDPDYINYVGNAIQGINPEDIERIDVLKDASATALYGTRAANGVIIVTTKKGKIGPPSIRYSTQFKWVERPHYSDKNINLMNSQERMQFGKDLVDLHYAFPSNMTMVGYEGAYYNLTQGSITYDQFLNEVQKYQKTNTDWFDILTQNALTQSHSLSISGGSETVRYYGSVGYTHEDGTVKTEYVDRYSASVNLMNNISEALKLSFNFNGNVQKKNHMPSEVNALNYAYNTTRALPAYNDDGSLYFYQKHAYNIGTNKGSYYKYNYNIINEQNNTSNDYDGNTIITSLNLTYKVARWLELTAAGSYSRSSTGQSTWFGEGTNYVAQLKNGEQDDAPIPGTSGRCDLPYGGVLNTSNSVNESMTGRFQGNFTYSFGKENYHTIGAMAGYEVSSNTSTSISDQTRGYFKDRGKQYLKMDGTTIDDYPYFKEWMAENHRTMKDDKTNRISGYLTASYSFRNYLTFNVNGRFDASNKFGSRSNEKFLPVWSTSGRVNLRDIFWKWVPWLNDAAVRLSFGKTGNMVDNQTPNLLISQGIIDAFYGENTSKVAYLPNPNLRWEQTDQWNVGLEFGAFDNRISFSTDAYYKKTHDAFSNINVSDINGVSTYTMNNGDITNYGFSFSLNGYPVKTKDWKLYLGTTYSYSHNTVKSNTSDNYSIDDYLNGTAIIAGHSIGTFYSYKLLGLNPNDGTPMFEDYGDRRHLLMGLSLAEIANKVMVISGSREPKFQGSLRGTLTWKKLSIMFNFNYQLGAKARLFSLFQPVLSGVTSDMNVRKEFNHRWLNPGDENKTNIPALMSVTDELYLYYLNHWSAEGSESLIGVKNFQGSVWDSYDKCDVRVVSTNYVRLSNLSLSYDFDRKILKKTPLKSLRLSLSTMNVFTIASKDLDGQDPTQASFTGVSLSLRPSFTFSLSTSF